MNEFVSWEPEALAMLAEIWLRATDRGAVTVAQAAIDRLLAKDPLDHGSPVSEGLFGLDYRPLRVLFEMGEVDGTVIVVSVRLLP